MLRIDHQVRVFVFQVLHTGIEYLLLRRKPTLEWPFAPVIGVVRPEEHMADTVIRQVQAETGIPQPTHLMDLLLPGKELFGDVGLVEWPFAYQAGAPSSPIAEICPGPTVGDFAWMSFPDAFETVDSERDRDCLVRLQVHLQS
jgi:NUDIX domain